VSAFSRLKKLEVDFKIFGKKKIRGPPLLSLHMFKEFARNINFFQEVTLVLSREHHSPMAGVTGSDTVVASGTSALEGIPAVDDALASDAEMSQAVIFLLDAGVGHASNSRPLLRQAQQVGPTAVGATAWCFDTLGTAVVRTSIPEMTSINTILLY
jgi:pterin-4a-carbinolamine dehydratase